MKKGKNRENAKKKYIIIDFFMEESYNSIKESCTIYITIMKQQKVRTGESTKIVWGLPPMREMRYPL